MVFAPALRNDFVAWDDPENIINNPHIRGLSGEHIAWAFSTFHMGHWQPLSWLTLMLDFTLWGARADGTPNPIGFHLTNILIHSANAALVFLLGIELLARARPETRQASRLALPLCAAGAALAFSIHPLRVESVVWATERRDVLSSLFLLLALLIYVRSANTEGRARIAKLAIVGVILLLGLMSKVSVVVAPVLMLIIDWYPLKRFPMGSRAWLSPALHRAILEKLPFFALSLCFGLIASWGQSTNKWLYSWENHGLGARLMQSMYGLGFYVRKTLLPIDLLPLYELRTPLLPTEPRLVVSAVLVIAAAGAVVALRKRAPWLAAAGGWYAATLAPVLGIMQNGPQIAADRYSYISCLPWAWVLGGAALFLCRREAGKAGVGAASTGMAAVLLALASTTMQQIAVWKNDESLWTHIHRHDPTAPFAMTRMGSIHLARGELAEAERLFRGALEGRRDLLEARFGLWSCLERQNRKADLEAAYREAIAQNPRFAPAHFRLGVMLLERGEHSAAAESLRAAIDIEPRYAEAHGALGVAFNALGDAQAAVEHLRESIRLKPDLTLSRYNLAVVLRKQGRIDEAIGVLEELLRIDPNYTDAQRALEIYRKLAAPAGATGAPSAQSQP